MVVYKFTDVSQNNEGSTTSETPVNFCQTTWRYNPEDSHLRTHSRKNLGSYTINNQVHTPALQQRIHYSIQTEISTQQKSTTCM
jgi:hypothetical protein